MRMLVDEKYREKVVDNITDPVVKSFWEDEFTRYHNRFQVEAISPIQNKVGQFLTSPLIRNIVGQTESSINMREVMDEGKILIMNLSKGLVGEDNSNLLGALMITKLQLAAMGRVEMEPEERRDFNLYVDEFQNFATESFASILSEARKYRLNLVLAHQYIAQLSEEVRDAVFGNVGTISCFRVGAEDAEFLEREFSPEFDANDLVNLSKFKIYLRLMIDGMASRPFSAKTLPPMDKPESSNRDEIVKVTRENYATPREEVEDKIARWSGFKKAIDGEKLEREESKDESDNLHETVCWNCGKKTKVPFEPDGERPVYCEDCLDKDIEDEPEHPPLEEIALKGTQKGNEKKKGTNNSSQKQSSQKDKNDEPDLEGLKEAIKDATKDNKEIDPK
jgi:CxxC-x17-CxxC domain-containing protein